MGLLDKATKVQSAATTSSSQAAPVTTASRTGLLQRAERLRAAAQQGGLFERARRLREETIGRGLFQRAQKLRDSEAPLSSRESGEFPLVEDFQDFPGSPEFCAIPEPAPEIDAGTAEALLFDEPEGSVEITGTELFEDEDLEDESITLTAEELADLQGPLSSSESSEGLEGEDHLSEQFEAGEIDQNVAADQLTDELTDQLPDFPDLTFDEHSSDETDPALLDDTVEFDPFEHWEQEAAREAESKSRELTGEQERRLFEDEEIMTTPVETHIGSQKRIDNYLSLFELNRELHSIDDAEEFWETALYSILGQIGARTVVIFAGMHDREGILYPVAHSGVIPTDDWNLKRGDEIYDALAASDEIRYAGEFLKETSGIGDLERSMLDKTKASVLMPLRQGKELQGIIVIGPPLDRADYIIDDLEYLRLLGSSLIGPLERIKNIRKHKEETENLARQNLMHRALADLTASLQTKKAVDEIYDLILDYFKKILAVDSLSLVLLDPTEQAYRIFAGSRISPESLKRFSLPVSGSELVGTISNLSGVYNLVDFRTHPEIVAAYSGDDLALMQHYWILPLINLNWLVGFITVHHTERAWTDEEREIALIACAQLAPVLANCLILQERETLFRDPFSPLEKRLEREVQKALEFHSFLSIVDFRVRNLKKVLGANSMSAMTDYFQALSRTLSRSLHQSDYLSRMGAGRYVLLLPGRGKTEANIFADRLQMELKQASLLRSSAVAPTYSSEVINFPDDGDSLQKLIALLDR